MTATNLVGGLSAEIERVSNKAQRWEGYARDNLALASGLAVGLALMRATLAGARLALNSGEIEPMIEAIRRLREYDDED
jgi:hypothetical protein